jgi:hypothetical protein
VYYNTDYVNMVSDYGNRSLMGEAQEQCRHTAGVLARRAHLLSGFYKQLSQSQARGASWRVVGYVSFCGGSFGADPHDRQQIVFTQLNELGSCT